MSLSKESSELIESAAPHGCARQPLVMQVRGKRLRRRGPRTQHAILRRSVPKRHRTLPGMSPGQAGDVMPENNIRSTSQRPSYDRDTVCMSDAVASNSSRRCIYILSLNIQCLLAHLGELCCHLELHRPHLVFLQETWLDATVEEVSVSGYTQVSRRDRSPTSNRGGVLALRRKDFTAIAHICNSERDERS